MLSELCMEMPSYGPRITLTRGNVSIMHSLPFAAQILDSQCYIHTCTCAVACVTPRWVVLKLQSLTLAHVVPVPFTDARRSISNKWRHRLRQRFLLSMILKTLILDGYAYGPSILYEETQKLNESKENEN